MDEPTLEVCLSPKLLPLIENLEKKVVVIIDVLRATSTIATALYNGAKTVIPVASIENCIRIGKEKNAITAGERDGKIARGLSHGNSPFEYPREIVDDQTIVLTTTNGTHLLEKSKSAKTIITGSFPNISAVCTYLIQQPDPVVLACAGWRGNINIEDTLFAGAVTYRVKEAFRIETDATLMAEHLYIQHQEDLLHFIKRASHFGRLERLGMLRDAEFCVTPDIAPSLPILAGGGLVNNL